MLIKSYVLRRKVNRLYPLHDLGHLKRVKSEGEWFGINEVPYIIFPTDPIWSSG